MMKLTVRNICTMQEMRCVQHLLFNKPIHILKNKCDQYVREINGVILIVIGVLILATICENWSNLKPTAIMPIKRYDRTICPLT